MKAYLARTKIIAFNNKQPNVLAKCVGACTQGNTQSFDYAVMYVKAVQWSMQLGGQTYMSKAVSYEM